MKLEKAVIIITILILLILNIMQYNENKNLRYCSKVWYEMYWSEVEKSLKLTQEVQDLERLTVCYKCGKD